MNGSFRLAHLALWLCAMIWGWVLASKLAMAYMGPLLFNALCLCSALFWRCCWGFQRGWGGGALAIEFGVNGVR